MKISWSLPFTALAAMTAACAIDDDTTAIETSELGGPSAVLTAVGELEAVVHIGNCTGTLVSQDTVITAGHCVCTESTFPATGCSTRKTVRFTNVLPIGSSVRQTVYVGADVLVNPDFNNGGWNRNDYALLHLDTRADQLVKVAPLRLSSVLPAVGETHMLVGYGGTGSSCDNSFGTKRKGLSVLDDIVVYGGMGGRTLTYNDTAVHDCLGDSGGPVISTTTGQALGVDSTSNLVSNSNYDPTSEVWGWLRANACTAPDAAATSATCREGPMLVAAYRDPSFGGISQTFGAGRWPVADLAQVGNDKISSLKVTAGSIARLWAEGGCWGDTVSYVPGNIANVSSLLDNRTSCIEVTPAATLYHDSNYGGIEQTFAIGGYNHTAMGIIGNDQAGSLIAAPGLVVRLCSESGAPGTVGWGNCQDFSGSVSSLGTLGDNASNVEVSSGVTVYRNANFGGIQQTFRTGIYGASALTVVGNDQISSLVVGPGLQARLCSENGAWGNCQTYTGAVSALTATMDNNTSSIEISAIP
jgi:hypothetical protein